MGSKLSHAFLQKKERNIIHWVMRDIEVGDVEMLNFRDTPPVSPVLCD